MKLAKRPIKRLIAFVLMCIVVVVSCQKEKATETILEGKADIYTDETVAGITEDQIMVFESQYKAKLNQINKSQTEIVNLFQNGKIDIAILSRKLSEQEEKAFTSKKVQPRITPFAKDAIVFISNKASNDTLVDLQQVIDFMNGKPSRIKGLVFDNPNSSTKRYIDSISGNPTVGNKAVYSLKSHEEVIKYVSENSGVIGVTGLNGIVQPYPNWGKFMQNITVMAVKNVKTAPNSTQYYKPTQYNLGEGLYPLPRIVYVLNYQGTTGLGMGFASFVAGDIGQRIVLKSGLLPLRIPERNIVPRNEIINNK